MISVKIIASSGLPNRVDINAKPYIIFKELTVITYTGDKVEEKQMSLTGWAFSKFMINNLNQVEIIERLETFDTLQKAFNHAEELGLNFF